MDEGFFWYWLTRVVPNKGPSNGCVCEIVPVMPVLITAAANGSGNGSYVLRFDLLYTLYFWNCLIQAL